MSSFLRNSGNDARRSRNTELKEKEDEENHRIVVEEYVSFLEVITHQILFFRGLYPEAIFERCRKYEAIVRMSRHPDLNFYIHESFHRIKPLLMQQAVKKVVICFKDKNRIPIEHYAFTFAKDKEGNENGNSSNMMNKNSSNSTIPLTKNNRNFQNKNRRSLNATSSISSSSPHSVAVETLHNEFRAIINKTTMTNTRPSLSSKSSFQILVYSHPDLNNSNALSISNSSNSRHSSTDWNLAYTSSTCIQQLLQKDEFIMMEENEASVEENCSEEEETVLQHLTTSMFEGTNYYMALTFQSKKKREE